MICTLLMSGVVTSCAAPLKTYSGAPKDPNSIARVRGASQEVAGQKYWSTVTSYAVWRPGEKPDFQSTNNIITGEASELQMLPGKYVLLSRCSTVRGYAFSAVDVDLAAGATYEILCGPVPDKLNSIYTVSKKIFP